MMRPGRSLVLNVVSQHAEDAAALRSTRSDTVRAPHVALLHLRRLDDRLAAHLDGLQVAGEAAWPLCEAALEAPTTGSIFTATIRALEDKRADRIDRLCAIAESVPEAQNGFISAFGWLEREQLRGVVVDLLSSTSAFRRMVGIAACAVQRVDPGKASEAALGQTSPQLRARALKAVGELGRKDAIPACLEMLRADDAGSRFWAAWSAVLLGDRGHALEALKRTGLTPGPFREPALGLALMASDPGAANALLRQLVKEPDNARLVIQGSGVAGDPAYVPWLIDRMADPALTRVAGEAFSRITGLDLAFLDLDRPPPEEVVSGPTDDAADQDVALDPDEDLPWPQVERIRDWWQSEGHSLTAGSRYFMGQPLGRSHCLEVLREGYQRERIAAAHHLCLLAPGSALFNTSAPAWRQTRQLAELT